MASRRLSVWLAIVLGAASLMAPAFIVGHPNVFPDTSAYDLVGQWLLEQAGIQTPDAYGHMNHRPDLALFFTMAGARSPYYGLLLYGVTARGSAWAMAALQALIASALVALGQRVLLGRFRLAEFAVLIVGLSLASSLSYFVSFMMPDVFLGFDVLAALVLMTAFGRLSRLEVFLLTAGLALTLPFHSTNAPVILCAGVAGGGLMALRLIPTWPNGRGVALALGAVGLSVLASALYAPVVEKLSHRELARPPFLSARLLADGPGRDYLKKVCGAPASSSPPFVLCRFQDRPLVDANTILWAADKKHGVFEPADLTTRLAMIHQEGRFVAAVVAADPWRTLWMLGRDSYLELTTVSVLDTLGYGDRNLITRTPRFAPPFPGLETCVRRPSYCNSTEFQRGSEDVLRWTLIAASLFLVLRLACGLGFVRRTVGLAALSPPLTAAILIAGLTVAANAAICGSLSGVYARYEMRLVWILPFLAGVAALQTWPLSLGGRRAPTEGETV
jgi:hypothetical protein